MSKMTMQELTVGKFTLLGSTSTTSINIVTAVSSTDSTASTSITITTQTLYFENGVIHDLGSATSTNIIDV